MAETDLSSSHDLPQNPVLSIVLPTKDRTPILFKTLESLVASTEGKSCEIFIIDNSTSADILLPENLQRANIRVLKNPRNRNSVFSSRNYGASLASGTILLFIDDDIIINPESIDWVIRFHSENQKAAANVNWQYPPWLLEQMQKNVFGRFLIRSGFTTMRELYGVHRWKENTLFESGEVASFFFSLRKETFDAMGGYEEKHLHEGTDIPLIESLRNANVPMYIHAGITVFHNEEDRVEPVNWLKRKMRMGEVSAMAVKMGKRDGHEFYYSGTKSFLLSCAWNLRGVLFFFIRAFPGSWRFADPFLFKLLSGLTGAYIHKGYKTGMKNS